MFVTCGKCVFSDQSVKTWKQNIYQVLRCQEKRSKELLPQRVIASFSPFSFSFKNLSSYFNSTSSSIYTVTPLSCDAVTGNKPPTPDWFLVAQPAVCTSSHIPIHGEGQAHNRPGEKGTPTPLQKEPRAWSQTPLTSFSSGKHSVKWILCHQTVICHMDQSQEAAQ